MEYTDKLNLEKPPRGFPDWDTPTNSNWDIVDSAIGVSGAENMIINGTFDVWQRGISQTASGYGSADRWEVQLSGAALTVSMEQLPLETEVGGNRPENVMKMEVVSSNSSSSEQALVLQKILGVAKCSGKTLMVRLSARRTGGVNNLSIEGIQGDSSGIKVTGIGPQKISLTESFQTFTIFINYPSVLGETYDDLNWAGFRIWASAGSDYDIETDTLGFQTGSCEIGEIEAVVSSLSVPVRRPSVREVKRLCEPYYQTFKSYAGRQEPFNIFVAINTVSISARIRFRVEMIRSPSVIFDAAALLMQPSLPGGISYTNWTPTRGGHYMILDVAGGGVVISNAYAGTIASDEIIAYDAEI